MDNEITIQVSGLVKHYIPIITNAPYQYDGFGTFTVLQDKFFFQDKLIECRVTLILKQYREWQISRYQSGSYICEPANKLVDIQYLLNILWERIEGSNIDAA